MKRNRSGRRSRQPAEATSKPRGVIHLRVQAVGPEHFGIVCFDCAKARSKFLLADFYGRVLIPPTTVTHQRPALDAAVAQVRQAFAAHQLRDGLVALERTAITASLNAPLPPPASRRASHPFATKQFARPESLKNAGEHPLDPASDGGSTASN